MPIKNYSYQKKDIYYPARSKVFRKYKASYAPQETAEFSLTQAWFMSNMSHLAYYDHSNIDSELQKTGLELINFYDSNSTQAFLAVTDSIAVLTFRGTDVDLKNYWTNMQFNAASFHNGKVHQGFLLALEEIWQDIEKDLNKLGNRSLFLTGHSLGAAMATLTSVLYKPLALYTFGSPRVGDQAFTDCVPDIPIYRFVNCCDLVCTIPPELIQYKHVGRCHFFNHKGQHFIDPAQDYIDKEKIRAIKRFQLSLSGLGSGNAMLKSLIDHSPNNYTAVLKHAIKTEKRRRKRRSTD